MDKALNLNQLKENQHFEAKLASHGLPSSLWETYSAFANSEGGTILLGLKEEPDGSYSVKGVSEPESLIKDFWTVINNRNKVSINLLTDRDIRIQDLEGKQIIAINVPKAIRGERPVFINNDILNGSYRRNGDGDFRCSKEEVKAMLRDAASESQDARLIEELTLDVLNQNTIRKYRTRFSQCREGHVWNDLPDDEFLFRIGAAGKSIDRQLHPTLAGVVMFADEYIITRILPEYFLDYRTEISPDIRWDDRITSSSGDWSGNIYDFFFEAYNRAKFALATPFRMDGPSRVDDTPLHKALREAIVNCLSNSDYNLPRGIVIVRREEQIEITNPGTFRISLREAECGGISEPRNAIIHKMFSLIDFSERAGSGIPSIFKAWKDEGLPAPQYIQSYEPERTQLILSLRGRIPSSISRRKDFRYSLEDDILEYIANEPEASYSDLAELTGYSRKSVAEKIRLLREKGLIRRVGGARGGHWEVTRKQ